VVDELVRRRQLGESAKGLGASGEVGLQSITLFRELGEAQLVVSGRETTRASQRQGGILRAQGAEAVESLAIVGAEAEEDEARGEGGFGNGAALAQERGGEGEAADAFIVQVRPSEGVEELLPAAQELQEARQAHFGEGEDLLTQVVLGGSQGTRQERESLGDALLAKGRQGDSFERVGDIRVVLAQGRLPYLQGPREQRLRARVEPLCRVEGGEVVERGGDIRVVLAQGRVPYLQGPS
jgi:hypothetical protein